MQIKYRTDLYKLLDHFGLSGDAVEIGIAEGVNAKSIISWPQIKKLYLIDSWEHLEQFGDGREPQSWHDYNYETALKNTEQFKEKRVVLRGMSTEMIKQIPDNSLIFSYIDADHSYSGCLNDLRAIWPKLKNGAILAGHDYLNPVYGVGEAVATFVNEIEEGCDIYHKINVIEEDEMPSAGFWIRKEC